MQIMAVSTSTRPEWRWRIVSNDGDFIEESRLTFGSIAAAVSEGADRARELDLRDVSQRIRHVRTRIGYTRPR
jgi:hypothetical protein